MRSHLKEILEVILDALIDSAKILPLLLAVYFLVELLEYKCASKFENSRLLKGNISPIFGSLFGCVPQCGFSVVATDLYAKRKLAIGALVAVYISTSDEALPLMLSTPKSIVSLLILIGVKLALGIGVGYLAMLLYPLFFKPKNIALTTPTQPTALDKQSVSTESQTEESHTDFGCCHHDIKKSYDWLHPLIHSLKIFIYLLIVNLIMGFIVYGVGEDNLIRFLSSSNAFQPLFACLVGLIPNCASSVIITQLYLMGGLSFGSIVAGLSVNAGLAFLVLFKQNKNIKENFFILGLVTFCSLAVGYALHFIF